MLIPATLNTVTALKWRDNPPEYIVNLGLGENEQKNSTFIEKEILIMMNIKVFRSSLIFFSFMFIFLFLLSGCGEKGISGKVRDVLGNPLEGVSVKIENSGYSTMTDDNGVYLLEYTPGAFKIKFSKDGYTTHSLDFNIAEKTLFPAKIVDLYPIPQENGIFYIDTAHKRLLKINENSKIYERKQKNKGFSMTNNHRYYLETLEPVIGLKPGKAMFIDRTPFTINLSFVNIENYPLYGPIYEGNLNMFEKQTKYSGFVEDSSFRVGKENLLIRTVELNEGLYSWVKMLKTDMIGLIPDKEGVAFSFKTQETVSGINPQEEQTKLNASDVYYMPDKQFERLSPKDEKEIMSTVNQFKNLSNGRIVLTRELYSSLMGVPLEHVNDKHLKSYSRSFDKLEIFEIWKIVDIERFDAGIKVVVSAKAKKEKDEFTGRLEISLLKIFSRGENWTLKHLGGVRPFL